MNITILKFMLAFLMKKKENIEKRKWNLNKNPKLALNGHTTAASVHECYEKWVQFSQISPRIHSREKRKGKANEGNFIVSQPSIRWLQFW